MNPTLKSTSALLTLCALACGTATPAERQPEPSALIRTTSAERRSHASAAPTPLTASPRPRLAARATTPGEVQCETVDCDLETEVCCVSDPQDGGDVVGTCVPKPANTEGSWPPWVCPTDMLVTQRSCDEAADCPARERCCTAPYDESNLKTERCDTQCGGELCLAGSICGNGNACDASAGERAGECPLEVKPPQCGKIVCKAKERCCWDAEANSGRCAADCGEETQTWFACTRPEHCAAHYDCNTWPGVNQYRCGGSGFQGGVLCSTVKDCPKHLNAWGTGPGAPEAKSCAHAEGLPPGVKACVYE